MINKFLPALLLLLLSFSNFQNAEICNTLLSSDKLVLKVKVIGIKDGDTVEVLYYQLPFTVRLEHIDAPEKKQAYGNVSKKKLADLAFGKMVTIISKKKKGSYDRNGRMIAEIYLENGVCVNKVMLQSGLAWHYKKYSSEKTYSDLEIIARKNKTGLWQDKNATAPWNFRGQ